MPVVQVSADPTVAALYGDDIDLAMTGVADDWAEEVGWFVGPSGARRSRPRCFATTQRRFSTDARFVGGFDVSGERERLSVRSINGTIAVLSKLTGKFFIPYFFIIVWNQSHRR